MLRSTLPIFRLTKGSSLNSSWGLNASFLPSLPKITPTAIAPASPARWANRSAVRVRLGPRRSDPSKARVDNEEPRPQPGEQPPEAERHGDAEERSEAVAGHRTDQHGADHEESRGRRVRPCRGASV